MIADQENTTVEKWFLKPMIDALEAAVNTRNCETLTDSKFMVAGVRRVIAGFDSGRDWVQKLHKILKTTLTVNCVFKGLRSDRRLRLVAEVADAVASKNDELAADDPFFSHPELNNFEIFAGDGHYHGASVHEVRIGGKKYPVQHFYAIDMRTRSIYHLDVARPAAGKKKEHDIKALKRLSKDTLRMGTLTGKKVLWSYDRACIDFNYWYDLKHTAGIYFLTREKDNMKLTILGKYDFDRNDPRNAGVIDDQMVGNSSGSMIRRILYTDPVSGKDYSFITNEFTLPPGILAFIYKERWNLEKVFDEVKNKLHEKKAWAKSDTAKCIQAKLIALTLNLLLIFERTLEAEEGITDEKVQKLRRERLEKDLAKAADEGRKLSSMLTAPKRATQRSVQFIRWLLDELAHPSSWRCAMETLRPLMARYLC